MFYLTNNTRDLNSTFALVVFFCNFKISLWMSANRTNSRSFFTNYDVTAVSTLPDCISVFAENITV